MASPELDNSSVRSPYVIPFGRVLGQSDGDPPLNEVMIGREDERAYFIDLLVSRGPTGSYLITGRRGIGKSSFVRHCLNEYGTAVFKRFLRSNSGKSLWDMAGMALLGAVSIAAALLISDMAKLLFSPPSGAAHNGLLYDFVAIPLILLCLFPLVFAQQLIEATLRNKPPIDSHEFSDGRGLFTLFFSTDTWVKPEGLPLLLESLLLHLSHHAAAAAGILTLVLGGLVWVLPPSGAPVITLGRYFVALCGLYAFVQLLSYESYDLRTAPDPMQRLIKQATIWLGASALFAIEMTADLFGLLQLLIEAALPELVVTRPVSPPWQHAAIGFILLCAGNVGRFNHLRRRWQRKHVVFALREGHIWYLIFATTALIAAVFCTVMAGMWEVLDSRLVATAVLVSSLVPLGLSHWRKEREWRTRDDHKSPHFRPRPRMLLGMKAVGAVLVALHLAHPGLTQFQSQHVPWLAEWAIFGREAPTAPDDAGLATGIRPPIALARVSGAGADPAQYLFQFRHEEIWWGSLLFLIVVIFYFVEYEWVVRPFMPARDERSLDPARRPAWEDQQTSDVHPLQRFQFRQMERLTFPWMSFATWLPTISITVNLGFDRLDHRGVIHAMLVGLRNEYSRQFLSWHSGFANVIRMFALLALLFITSQLGDAWFALPGRFGDRPVDWQRAYLGMAIDVWTGDGPEKPGGADPGRAALASPLQLTYKRHPDDRDDRYCQFYDELHKWELRQAKERLAQADPAKAVDDSRAFTAPPGLRLLCTMWHSDFWISAMYFDLARVDGVPEAALRNTILSVSVGPLAELPIDAGPPVVALRGYHVMLGMLLFMIGRWTLFWLPLLPYRRNLSRIDDLLDSLSARTVHRRSSWKPAQWIRLVFGDDPPSEVEHAPADSRTTELAFMEILRDLQSNSVALLDGTLQRISVPAPEITFVFDELDKLGANLDAEQSLTADTPEDMDLMGAERQRSLALHRLMSDLKQILSAAPARFIFVGGRQLHDEWLADQTSRQPLLTSIFNTEVYLPSLLTDHGLAHLLRAPNEHRLALHDRIAEYLALQHWRASQNMAFWTSTRWRPSAGLTLRREEPGSFHQPGADGTPRRRIEQQLSQLMVICPSFAEGGGAGKPGWSDEFLMSFVRFLTYRSAGNPKRLRELMLGFLEPVGRVITDDVRWSRQSLACHDVLYFNDDDIYRVQLLDSVYRDLVDRFGSRLVRRDDKIAVSLFFVADFLFKFHLRAFAWGNLERIEELVHIHRAPDMRLILEELVEHCSSRFLHRVLNGMYTFRFRSELAREIEYLSRRSEDDLAAFNFTLDESQALKRPYMAGLRTAKVDNPEVFAGAGELFEFDEEFEMARQHYRTAITLLDKDLEQLMAQDASQRVTFGNGPEWSAMGEVMAGGSVASHIVVPVVAWGLARLRLMLQIGMTYELAHNEERAEAEYRGGFVLAERLLDAYLENADAPWPDDAGTPPPGDPTAWRFRSGHSVKHFVLLYQPVFAIAWIAEKLIGDVDAGTSIVEEYLDRVRDKLPFVKRRHEIAVAKPGERSSHSNFALIVSELHRKAGDLYFFKGRQEIPVDDIYRYINIGGAGTPGPDGGAVGKRTDNAGPEGFLLRAHLHYITALHELRRNVQSRMRGSAVRYNGQNVEQRTILERQFPNYVHLAIGNALSDLSDSMLSRVSLFEVLTWLGQPHGPVPESEGDAAAPSDAGDWLSDEARRKRLKHLGKCVVLRNLTTAERWEAKTFCEQEAADLGEPPDGAAEETATTRRRASDFQKAFSDWFETDAMAHRGALPKAFADCEAPAIAIQQNLTSADGKITIPISLDELGDWIGHWSCKYCHKQSRDPVMFGKVHQSHLRLLATLHLSELSGKYFGRSGQWNDAAREHSKTCETVCTFLWWIAGLQRAWGSVSDLIKNDPLRAAVSKAFGIPVENGSDPAGAADAAAEGPLWGSVYLPTLASMAVKALQQAIHASARSHLGRDGMNREPRGYLRDGTLPPSLLTLACSVYLATDAVGCDAPDQREALAAIIADLTGDSRPVQDAAAVRAVLNASIRRCRFPMLNRLNALHTLINAELLGNETPKGPEGERLLEGIDGRLREWLDLLDAFDAPLHVSPLAIGSTLAWFCMALEHCIDVSSPGSPTSPLRSRYWKHQRAAHQHLDRSLQMHTMGAAYYEGISNLFYLYDDFNDRHIHYLHAMQMAGTELISVLRTHLLRTGHNLQRATA